MATGIIALSLNSSAYVSEIIRAGIEAVDNGADGSCKKSWYESKAGYV